MSKPDPSPDVIIERDYTHGIEIQFETDFPAKLEGIELVPIDPIHSTGIITHDQFNKTVTTLNQYFKEAEKITPLTVIEGLVAFLTLQTYYLCIDGQYERVRVKSFPLIFWLLYH